MKIEKIKILWDILLKNVFEYFWEDVPHYLSLLLDNRLQLSQIEQKWVNSFFRIKKQPLRKKIIQDPSVTLNKSRPTVLSSFVSKELELTQSI